MHRCICKSTYLKINTHCQRWWPSHLHRKAGCGRRSKHGYTPWQVTRRGHVGPLRCRRNRRILTPSQQAAEHKRIYANHRISNSKQTLGNASHNAIHYKSIWHGWRRGKHWGSPSTERTNFVDKTWRFWQLFRLLSKYSKWLNYSQLHNSFTEKSNKIANT